MWLLFLSACSFWSSDPPRLVLTCAGCDADRDGPEIVERLQALGHSARLEPGAPADTLWLRTDAPADQDLVQASLKPGILRMASGDHPNRLDNRHVSAARVDRAPATGAPQVHVVFTADGQERLCDLTRDVEGRELSIAVDNVTVSRPVVSEPICGGRAVIDPGLQLESLQRAQEWCELHALMLAREPLSGRWELQATTR